MHKTYLINVLKCLCWYLVKVKQGPLKAKRRAWIKIRLSWFEKPNQNNNLNNLIKHKTNTLKATLILNAIQFNRKTTIQSLERKLN